MQQRTGGKQVFVDLGDRGVLTVGQDHAPPEDPPRPMPPGTSSPEE